MMKANILAYSVHQACLQIGAAWRAANGQPRAQ
jgi:hypothetical protein